MKQINLTDRERILSYVIGNLASTQMHQLNDGFTSASFEDRVHFAYDKKPQTGDLVMGNSIRRRPHEWSIGWYVEPLEDGAVIREIGSKRLCNYINESFVPIYGLREEELLERYEYKMFQKVCAAFGRGDEYNYRQGQTIFGGRYVEIWVREVFGGCCVEDEESVPFKVWMPWTTKTSVKQILEAMRAQGYGTHKFERRKKL